MNAILQLFILLTFLVEKNIKNWIDIPILSSGLYCLILMRSSYPLWDQVFQVFH